MAGGSSPRSRWVLQGTDDNHNSFEEVAGYWSAALPRTPITAIQGGGRFLTSSHPDLFVDHPVRLGG